MVETGILSEEDRTELIDGEIIEMAPIGSRHAGHVTRLVNLLSNAVGDAALVSVQNPVRLGEHSEPQPDLALLEPKDDFYTSAHPTADDVLLAVEIAETSLEYDRSAKIPLYASHGVRVVWLLDLRDRSIEVYEQPGEDGYQVVHTLRGDTVVEHEELGLRFDVADVFV
jgi:Uma2 family endonuclease